MRKQKALGDDCFVRDPEVNTESNAAILLPYHDDGEHPFRGMNVLDDIQFFQPTELLRNLRSECQRETPKFQCHRRHRESDLVPMDETLGKTKAWSEEEAELAR